jgi:hypothetical protein
MKKILTLLIQSQKKLIQAYRPCEIIMDFILKLCFVSDAFCKVLMEDKAAINQLANWVRTFKNAKDHLLKEKGSLKVFAKKPSPNLKVLEGIRIKLNHLNNFQVFFWD